MVIRTAKGAERRRRRKRQQRVIGVVLLLLCTIVGLTIMAHHLWII